MTAYSSWELRCADGLILLVDACVRCGALVLDTARHDAAHADAVTVDECSSRAASVRESSTRLVEALAVDVAGLDRRLHAVERQLP